MTLGTEMGICNKTHVVYFVSVIYVPTVILAGSTGAESGEEVDSCHSYQHSISEQPFSLPYAVALVYFPSRAI